MSDRRHPLRSAKIAVYQRIKGNVGAPFTAHIEPRAKHPIYFTGATAEEAEANARIWCNARADENEASFIARAERAAKRKGKATA